jgi:rhomboid protease GluP
MSEPIETQTLPPILTGGGAEEIEEGEYAPAPLPCVTIALMTVNLLVFLAMWKLGNGDVNRMDLAFGSKNAALIHSGQIWRLLTPIFLHGGWLHLIVNELSLLMLGVPMEQIYGARKFFLIYMFAGVAGFAASTLRAPEVMSVGASGAIFGLVGAGLIFPVRFRSLVPERARSLILKQLSIVTAVNLGIGFALSHYVDNYAHMGGLVGGAFLALFLIPDVLEEERRPLLSDLALWLAVAGTLMITGWAVASQWRWGRMWIAAGTPPPMVTYPRNAPDSWWSIGIPVTWAQKDGFWQSKQGAVVSLEDSTQDGRAIIEAANLIKAAGRKAESLRIDGKPAWHAMEVSTRQALDLYLIYAYGRLLVVRMVCARPALAASERDFAFIVESVRFIHAPPEAASEQMPSDNLTPLLPDAR